MLKKTLFVLLAALSYMAFADIAPNWTQSLPNQPGKVFGLGMATIHGDIAQANSRAAENAKVELLMSLQATVKSQRDTFTSSETYQSLDQDMYASQQDNVDHKSSFETAVKNLPGLRISETYQSSSDNTVYALAELNVQLARAAIVQQQQDTEQTIQLLATTDDGIQLLSALQQAKAKLAQLLQLSNMLSSQLDGLVHQANRELQQKLNQASVLARQQLSFAWDNSSNSLRHQTMIKRLVSDMGLTWKPQQASFYIRVHSEEQPSYNSQYKTTTIHSYTEVALLDAQGNVLKTNQFSAKGVSAGQYVAPAQRQLEQQIQQEMKKTFELWFSDF